MKTETYTITGCARCGDMHPVEFKPLTRPIEVHDFVEGDTVKGAHYVKVIITHWGLCPNLNEPLLMNIKTT
jgi:hypothetical protein